MLTSRAGGWASARQLLTARGVIVQDLKCTLPNLYLLLSHEAEIQARRRDALRLQADLSL